MRLRLVGLSVALLTVPTLQGSGEATVIFTSLSATGTYNQTYGNIVVGDSENPFGFDAGSAAPFVPDATYTLDYVELGVSGGWFAPTDEIEVILSSSDGGRPGAQMESLGTVSGFPAFGDSNSYLAQATSSVHSTLVGGSQYWIVLLPATSYTDAVWNTNTEGFTTRGWQGPDWVVDDGLAGAMRVVGTAVPEPSSLVLLGAGLAALARCGRHRPPAPLERSPGRGAKTARPTPNR